MISIKNNKPLKRRAKRVPTPTILGPLWLHLRQGPKHKIVLLFYPFKVAVTNKYLFGRTIAPFSTVINDI